jgi:hypothetical protein
MAIPLLALLPLITVLAPLAGKVIGNAVGGGSGKVAGEEVGEHVQEILGDVFGTSEPDEIEKLARTNPEKAAEARVRLNELATSVQLETLKGEVENLKSAREAMVSLAKSGSSLAWGPTIITTIVTCGFFGILGVLVFYPLNWDERQARLIDMALGALILAFGNATNFWIGSSHGSKQAGQTVAAQAQQAVTALATSVPAEVATSAQRNLETALARPGGQAAGPSGVFTAPAVTVTPAAPPAPARAPMEDAPGAADRLNDEAWRTAREG